MTNLENTLVTFYIGRGGRFHNQGHLSLSDFGKSIQEYTSHLFCGYKNEAEVEEEVKNRFESEGLQFNESDFIDCLSDRNTDKLKDAYGVEESSLGAYGYKDGNSNWLNLSLESITGKLDEDGLYDTTYVCELKDCDENELQLIAKSTSVYVLPDILAYVNEKLGVEMGG